MVYRFGQFEDFCHIGLSQILCYFCLGHHTATNASPKTYALKIGLIVGILVGVAVTMIILAFVFRRYQPLICFNFLLLRVIETPVHSIFNFVAVRACGRMNYTFACTKMNLQLINLVGASKGNNFFIKGLIKVCYGCG